MWKRLRLKACGIIRRYLWRDHREVETKWMVSGPASLLPGSQLAELRVSCYPSEDSTEQKCCCGVWKKYYQRKSTGIKEQWHGGGQNGGGTVGVPAPWSLCCHQGEKPRKMTHQKLCPDPGQSGVWLHGYQNVNA